MTPVKNNKILFYSSLPNTNLFKYTGFYVTDIEIFRRLNCIVETSNRLFDFMKFWNYDIAFIYFYRYGIFGAIIARFFGKRVFFTGGIDELDFEMHKSKKRYLVQKVFFIVGYWLSTKCIIVSKSDLKNVKTLIPNGRKLVYLPHVIETESYRLDNRKKQNIFTSIVWMGNRGNVVRKGVDKAILLFKEFLKTHPDFTFYIIGTKGDGTDFLKDIITQNGMPEGKVIFTGSIDECEKIELLKNSKYYFQLSKFEGFGIAALEALCAGAIVFHSGKGALKEVIGDFGVLINTDELDNQLRKVLSIESEYSLKSDFIINGLNYACNQFSYSVRETGIKNIIFGSQNKS